MRIGVDFGGTKIEAAALHDAGAAQLFDSMRELARLWRQKTPQAAL